MMKTTKRLLAMLLATAMVMSLLVPTAFATTVDQIPSATSADLSGSVASPITEIPVYKTVKTTYTGVALPSETFYVQMVPATTDEIDGATVGGTEGEDGNVTGGTAVEAGIALAEPILAFDFSSADKSSTGSVIKSESFDVSEFAGNASFTHSGVYRYYITEVKPVYGTTTNGDDQMVSTDEIVGYQAVGEQSASTQYIVYDNSKYTVDLYVASGSNNDYVITNVTVRKDEATTKPTSINFINTIQCATIKITKIVDGDQYLTNEEFNFHILIPEKGDTITLGDNDTVQATIYNSDGTAAGEMFTLNVKGDDIDADVEQNGTAFKLKAGQYLEITAPISMIYKVQEEVPAEENYTVSVTYQEYGEFSSSTTAGTDLNTHMTSETRALTTDESTTPTQYTVTCVKGTTNTNTNNVIFTNTRHVIVASGINLDILPYVLVLAIALGGCILIFAKKRRTIH